MSGKELPVFRNAKLAVSMFNSKYIKIKMLRTLGYSVYIISIVCGVSIKRVNKVLNINNSKNLK